MSLGKLIYIISPTLIFTPSVLMYFIEVFTFQKSVYKFE